MVELHVPVMLNEVLESLSPKDGGVYVDGTFGNGGYTKAILDAADCMVIAIDRDKDAIKRAEKIKAEYGDRFQIIHGCFGDMADLLSDVSVGKGLVGGVDGVVLDIGVSSVQLDTPERGFSFRFDAELDMRMDNTSGISAKDFVNSASATGLADVIYKYGEERHSRKIASAIVRERAEKDIETTVELADIVRKCVPLSKKEYKAKVSGAKVIDAATKTFQALRIYVNDELGELERGLVGGSKVLKKDGRLVVVTFHSLEDRIVKRYFRKISGNEPKPSRHSPEAKMENFAESEQPSFKLNVRRALCAGEEEIKVNPRSRSAKLRCVKKQDSIIN
ncbi:MAG: 16S rRNA (cytosine(1402)-N(4))-methyltransferase RsmH [Alphaproteobacteria bacterium]|nr:16S rRNA (cytosine(1402)-N(4))-methyltransferase RsmH [Alphaproteobacteria bacterium]